MIEESGKNQQTATVFGGSVNQAGRDMSNSTTINVWISIIIALAIGGGVAYLGIRHQQTGLELELENRDTPALESNTPE